MNPIVISVNISASHTMKKKSHSEIKLVKDFGIEGDVHSGIKVKHRSRLLIKPSPPNLRQVHLIHIELFDELAQKGFLLIPGEIGENITTQNIDLLALPNNTILSIGNDAKIKLTGLRNPCSQLDGIKTGLMKAVLDKDINNNLIRKSGVMGIVVNSGIVKPGDEISIEFPKVPHEKLKPV